METRARENKELAQGYEKLEKEVKAQNVRAAKAAQDAAPKDIDRFHKLHTWCQPLAAALTAILIAASKYSISEAVNHDEAGIEGMQWLIANMIGYGIPGFLMPLVFWNSMGRQLKIAFAWILLSLLLSAVLVAAFWAK
jgi:hypothetical protein